MRPTLLLGALGLAAGCLIGYNTTYVPYRSQVGVIRTRIAQEQTRQQARSTLAGVLQQIAQDRSRLPDEPDPTWLVREVMDVMQRARVPVSSLTQAPPQTLESFTRLSVTLKITASYHQLGTVIDAIERSPRFLRVDALKLTPASHGVLADIELRVSTVYVPSLVPSEGA